jgi:hypothetical protein
LTSLTYKSGSTTVGDLTYTYDEYVNFEKAVKGLDLRFERAVLTFSTARTDYLEGFWLENMRLKTVLKPK